MSVRKKIVKSTTPEGEQIETLWWIADYADGSGKRHQERFKRKAEAVAHEEKSKVAIRTGNYVAIDHDVTLADAADRWLNRVEANGMRGRGPVEFATLRQYRQHVNLHIVPRIGAVKLAKVGNPVPEEAVPLLYPGSNLPAKVLPEEPQGVVIDFKSALAEFTK